MMELDVDKIKAKAEAIRYKELIDLKVEKELVKLRQPKFKNALRKVLENTINIPFIKVKISWRIEWKK